ncbi:uncharacterized protein LOC124530410 isoform X2 [Vanessa cardui]|uniref:uncharacterized protein LOC124530410 isoform X2 n=1 Tax=Vanessa cardui TaxID=171605 RepID=UPI001F12F2EA|nr:uncharacterized protein LOC124530410 isoform X2 [Vanessa cardui]
MKHMYKRSFTNKDEEIPEKSLYSLNNVKINLICNKDATSTAYLPKDNYFGTNTVMSLYYDITGIEKEKPKGLKTFFRKFSRRRKSKKKKIYNNTTDMKSNVQIKDPLLQKEEHSLFNYFNGYKKYKRMSDFHLKSTQEKPMFYDGTYITTKALKSDNANDSNYVSSSRQNVIKDFKLSDFTSEPTRNNAILINMSSTTFKISGPILLSSKTNKDVNATTKSHHTTQSRTNFTNASNKLSTTTKSVQKFKTKSSNNLIKSTTLSNVKTNSAKITNSSRDGDKKVGGHKKNFNVLNKLKCFTLKCLKNSSTKRHHASRAIFMPSSPKKYTLTTTLKYSEVKDDILTDDTTLNSPTIIIFDDIPTPTNNHEYFDINCLLVKKNMNDKENDEINPLNKPSYKSMDNITNNIQLNSLIELNSQKPILDRIGADSNDHYDKTYSVQDKTVTTFNYLYDKPTSLNYSQHLSPRDRLTGKSSKGLLDKIAEKFVIKIVPQDKHVVKSEKATSTTIMKQGKEQKPLHLNNNEQQNGSPLSTTRLTVVLST